MKNELQPSVNIIQSIIKLQLVKENLEGVSEALSEYDQPKLTKAYNLIDEVLTELFKNKRKDETR